MDNSDNMKTFLSGAGVEQAPIDVICFSHLRWNFVYQRPQHLMSRFANQGRVFFIEEPLPTDGDERLDIVEESGNIFVCIPRLHSPQAETAKKIADKLSDLCLDRGITRYIAWFYTPMMVDWSRKLSPLAVVYDCMDELSAFKNAPPQLREQERRLFEKADLVFTGGMSLYEAKKAQHHSVHGFPSSIDTKHFAKAKAIAYDVPEQASIPHPRIGFVGVIDERSDLELIGAVADLCPDHSFVMVGPVVKIEESSLPRRENIHYLGPKNYDELPGILSGWDVAMMPFALNESTRYISPTKTPEYLAAGLPVVSTAIADVVRPYGDLGLVNIAATPEEFAVAISEALEEDGEPRRHVADEFLSRSSWDKTFEAMSARIAEAIARNDTHAAQTA
jgi:UDP-galactopyranose mutase